MIMLTDWMAARMIGLGWIQPLDAGKIPNLHKNLIPRAAGPAVGPGPRSTTPRGRAA